MYKVLSVLLLLSAFLLFSPKQVFATNYSGYVTADNLISSAYFTTPENIINTNLSFAIAQSANSYYIKVNQSNLFLNGNYKIKSVLWKIYGNTGGAVSPSIKNILFRTDTSEKCQNTDPNSTLTTSSSGTTQQIDSGTVLFSDCNNSAFGVSGGYFIQKENEFGFEIAKNSTSNIEIDYITLAFGYDIIPAYTSTDNATASPSAGLVLMDLSGDVATHGANLSCQVTIFHDCSRTGYARDLGVVPDAYIDFISGATYSATVNTGANHYTPTSADLDNSGSWSVDGISVPFMAGWSCTYPTNYTCTQQVCSTYTINGVVHQTCGDRSIYAQGQSIAPFGANYNSSLIATSSATTNTTANVEPDCQSDIWCSARNWFFQTAKDIFIPKNDLNTQYISLLRDDLYTRAPFAYVAPIFSIDLSNPSTTSAVPVLAMTFPASYFGGTNNITYNWTDTSTVTTVTSGFRTVTEVLLWGAFVIYLYTVARRII
jgi:hypothetical protein